MMAASILDPKRPGFDHVVVVLDGGQRRFSYAEFMAFPLADRIQMILAGTPTFYRGDQIVEKKKALALG